MAFNSTEVAWRDMKVYLNGTRIGKIKKLKYKTSRETEHLHGAGDDPFGINPGNKTFEGEVEVYKSVVDEMNKVAKAAGYDDITDLPWIIVADYKATATALPQTATLPNVIFSEYEMGMENNDKSMEVNLPFKCLKPEIV